MAAERRIGPGTLRRVNEENPGEIAGDRPVMIGAIALKFRHAAR